MEERWSLRSTAGQTPAKLCLSPRRLRIRLFLQGYKERANKIVVFGGSEGIAR